MKPEGIGRNVFTAVQYYIYFHYSFAVSFMPLISYSSALSAYTTLLKRHQKDVEFYEARCTFSSSCSSDGEQKMISGLLGFCHCFWKEHSRAYQNPRLLASPHHHPRLLSSPLSLLNFLICLFLSHICIDFYHMYLFDTTCSKYIQSQQCYPLSTMCLALMMVGNNWYTLIGALSH